MKNPTKKGRLTEWLTVLARYRWPKQNDTQIKKRLTE